MKVLTYKTLKAMVESGGATLHGQVFGNAEKFKYADVTVTATGARGVVKVIGSVAGMEGFFGLPVETPVEKVRRPGYVYEYSGPNFPDTDYGQSGPTGHGDDCHSDADGGL